MDSNMKKNKTRHSSLPAKQEPQTTLSRTNAGKISHVTRTTVDDFIDKWGSQKSFFRDLVVSGFLPDALNTPEKAMAVTLAGKELGVPPMLAMRKINIIKGIPTVSPELMWALARRGGKLAWYRVDENTDKMCKITLKRTDEDIEHTEVFTFEEAAMMKTKEDGKIIPLTEKFNWRTMPKVMLFSRCSSRILRRFMGDVVFNLYTNEEIEDSVIDEASTSIVEVDENRVEAYHEVMDGAMNAVFDPSKERVGFGTHEASLWVEVPGEYLSWLKKNGRTTEIRVKAEAALKYRDSVDTQRKPEKSFAEEQFAQPIEILESELDELERTGTTAKLSKWVTESLTKIKELSESEREKLRKKIHAVQLTLKNTNRKGTK